MGLREPSKPHLNPLLYASSVSGVDQWEVTSQGVNTLATWMIEHPQDTDQPEPPIGSNSSEGEITAATAPLDGATAAKRTNRSVG